MKKILLMILLCGVMTLGVVGCGKKKQKIDQNIPDDTEQKVTEEYDKQLVQCGFMSSF